MWRPVRSYALIWRADKGEGYVEIQCEDGTRGLLGVGSPVELEALGSILRFEKPIFWSEALKAIRTGPEPPGEEETP